MYYFLVDFQMNPLYTLAAPQGVNVIKIIENLAIGSWQLAIGHTENLPRRRGDTEKSLNSTPIGDESLKPTPIWDEGRGGVSIG
jgi:hypothetical protein